MPISRWAGTWNVAKHLILTLLPECPALQLRQASRASFGTSAYFHPIELTEPLAHQEYGTNTLARKAMGMGFGRIWD